MKQFAITVGAILATGLILKVLGDGKLGPTGSRLALAVSEGYGGANTEPLV